jgi:hypothetical protein
LGKGGISLVRVLSDADLEVGVPRGALVLLLVMAALRLPDNFTYIAIYLRPQ